MLFLSVTDQEGNTSLNRVEIARGSDDGDFTYVPGENDTTVYRGNVYEDGLIVCVQ